MTPTIVMIGADKGGVGKTTVTRALVDYCVNRGGPLRVFDTQTPAGDLRTFYPNAEVVNLEVTTDQMRVFDALEQTNIIDIRGGLLAHTLDVLNHVGMLEDVRAGAVKLVLLHVLGPSQASLAEMVTINRTLGDIARLLIVKNHVNPTEYYGWAEDPRFAEHLRSLEPRTITVPYLDPAACERVQALGTSFATFAADGTQSRMLRGYVRAWLQSVQNEFDRVKVFQ